MNRSRKRIALNGRFSGVAEPSGTQIAAFHLFDRIVRRNRDFELVVFADLRFPGVAAWRECGGTVVHHVPFRDWAPARAHLWEQIALPLLCGRHSCAAAHHPITTSPWWRHRCRHIVTLHDLNFYLHPEWYSRAFRAVYAICALPGLRRADWVVAISDYVRRQASEFLGIPEGRLERVYNGGKSPVPLGNVSPPGRYVLCVGALPRHKNLVRMIEAFLLVRGEFPDLELRLAGRAHPRQGSEDDRLSTLLSSPGVRKLGYLSEADLAAAYAGAEVFCYPSLEEGFGLPVLEAMAAGTPVLTSDRSCLPEIAGPSAILVDPYSVEAIAEGLRRALRLSPAERNARAEAGRAWAARFTWEAAADQYLSLYGRLF